MEVEEEEIVDVIETVVLDVAARSASNATNSATLHVNAKRIRIFAIAATALAILLRIANRLVQRATFYLCFCSCSIFTLFVRIFSDFCN